MHFVVGSQDESVQFGQQSKQVPQAGLYCQQRWRVGTTHTALRWLSGLQHGPLPKLQGTHAVHHLGGLCLLFLGIHHPRLVDVLQFAGQPRRGTQGLICPVLFLPGDPLKH